MRVKFEVRSFNRFKLVWLTGLRLTDTHTHRHTSNENRISAIHLAEKDDQQSQWEMPYFWVCHHQNPRVNFQKFCRVDYVGDPTPHASIGISRFKGGLSAHAWNCLPRVSIFLVFLGLVRLDNEKCQTGACTAWKNIVKFLKYLTKYFMKYFMPKNSWNFTSPSLCLRS